MAVKDKYQIERRYITNKNARSRQKLSSVRFIVSHETANNGADADNHYHFFNRINNQTSAHTFIDDQKILEIIPLDEKAWHVRYNVNSDNRIFGDDANDAAIGVELCRPGSFRQAYDRYVWYHTYLCKKFQLHPQKHIVAHSTLDPQRRRDPESWLKPNGVTWNEFIRDVLDYYNSWENDEVISKTPKTQVKSAYKINYLKRGDTGNEVREMQEKLLNLGYTMDGYGADGSFGPATERALKQFQRDYRLTVDGFYGPESQKALANAKRKTGSTTSSRNYLIRGDTGSRVREMQEKLQNLGYTMDGYGADGSFGPATERALKQFQSDYGLQVDGSYGPESQRALAKAKPNSTVRSKFNLPNATYWVKSPQFHGKGVKAVQEALASIYFYPESGAKNNGVDGYYGPKTADAVRRFQIMYMGDDEVDGSYGPKTKQVLEKVLASR